MNVAIDSPVAYVRRRPSSARRIWNKSRITVWRIVLFGGSLAFWEVALRLGLAKVYFYGQPSGVLRELYERIADGRLLMDTGITAYEAILGFVVGGALGSLCGLLLWLAPTLEKVLRPLIIAMNGFPKIALAPLLIVWFGIGYESKIAIAAIITFLVGLITAAAGTKEIDDDLFRLMRSLGATPMQIFRKIVLPASIPWVISGFRLNVGFALIGAVSGEYIAAKRGLGSMIYNAGQTYELNAIWAGIFALMLLAMVMDRCVALLERALRRN
jgi:NitT/TauT family transport system permease protein